MPLIQGKLVEDPNNNLSLQTANNLFVITVGDDMKGNLKMNNNLIKDLGNPIADNDAVRKVYVYNLFLRLKSKIDELETKNTVLEKKINDDILIAKDELNRKIVSESSILKIEMTNNILDAKIETNNNISALREEMNKKIVTENTRLKTKLDRELAETFEV